MSNDIRTPLHITAMVIAGIFAVAIMAMWTELAGRSAQLNAVDDSLQRSVTALGQNVSDSMEMADLVLVGLEAKIRAGGGIDAIKGKLTDFVGEFSEHARDLRNLHVIGADGRLRATTVASADMQQTFSDRAYFIRHANDPSDALFLGSPIVSRLSGERIVTVTRRLNAPDGSFNGVLVAHLSIERFNDLLDVYLRAYAGASALLIRTDGTVLSTTADFASIIGQTIAVQKMLGLQTVQGTQAANAVTWPVDGIARHTASYVSNHPGFMIVVGMSTDAVFDHWMHQARSRWIVGSILLVSALLLTLRWYGQARLHHESRLTLQQREQELQLLAQASGDLIERLSVRGRREYVSAASLQVLGRAAEGMLGTLAFDHLPNDDRQSLIDLIDDPDDNRPIQPIVTRYTHPEGREVWLETTLSRLDNGGTLTGFVAITRDVTRRKLHHDELDALANTDTLTGLANRRAFDRAMDERLRQARESRTPVSLLMIDVDRFKSYNDSYGHTRGDDCLKAVAAALRDGVRRSDIVSRYGGEEFAVILESTRADNARIVADKIRQKVAALRLSHDRNVPWGHVTVSVGIATLDDESLDDASALIERADAALYAAKGSGRNRVASYGELSTDADTLRIASA